MFQKRNNLVESIEWIKVLDFTFIFNLILFLLLFVFNFCNYYKETIAEFHNISLIKYQLLHKISNWKPTVNVKIRVIILVSSKKCVHRHKKKTHTKW